MNEANENEIKQRPVSKFAVISFYSSILMFISLLLRISSHSIFYYLFLFFSALSIISAVAALVSIKKSKLKLKGNRYAIDGLIMGALGMCMIYLQFLAFDKCPPHHVICREKMAGLGKALIDYSRDNDGKFPMPDKWCDLIEPYCQKIKEKPKQNWYDLDFWELYIEDEMQNVFVCSNAKRNRSTAKCHYAINPNAKPDSSKDTVLLFETTGGWNQYGGAELITAENHNGFCCHIVYCDGRVEAVAKEDFGKLNWGQKKIKK
jgi:hypothetical protein